jgi:hypothetical protein
MAFEQSIIKNPTRSVAEFPKAGATVYAKGAIIAKDLGSNATLPATSSTPRSSVLGVTTEAVAAADARTEVLGLEIFSNDVFLVDSTNNSNAAHYGQRMVLTNSTTVNNTGTDDAAGIVYQVGVYGAPADKKIIVKFV